MSITKHNLIPEHKLLTDKQKETLLNGLHVTIKELPKIKITDPSVQALGAKSGDVIQITRESRSAKESQYYRAVIE